MLRVVRSFNKHKKALKYIAERISKENKTEINIIMPDTDIEKALFECAKASKTGFFFFDFEGNPRAVGGVTETKNVWFVVTKNLTKRELIPWLKKSRCLIQELTKKYSPLWGHWYEKNTLSKLWLDWSGFDFAPHDSPANIEVEGHRFIYFQKN